MSAVRDPLSVERLVRRLAECPPEMLLEPRMGKAGAVDVPAVVSDLIGEFGVEGGLSADLAMVLSRADRNLLRLTLVGAWLCHDPAVREDEWRVPGTLRWLLDGLRPLAALAEAETFVTDADRREELVRSLLAALGETPAGESAAVAADRLRALSTVERAGVLRDTRAQQARARQLRQALAEERARQAAARYSSE